MKSEEDFNAISEIGNSVQSGMIITLVIPFGFMIFMSVSMNRVWALYNMLQLLNNLEEYRLLAIPPNLGMILDAIGGMVNFSILDSEIV